MPALRTPSARFAHLPDYPFAEHYAEVPWPGGGGPLRLHYVDEGPRNGPPVLMLHGEPSWSYLYRSLIPIFAEAGYRALAPDLIGFGKSDKPTSQADYSYQAHVDWMTAWITDLDLEDITLVCQDWGSLIGLRLAAEMEPRFARIVVANGFLPTADRGTPAAFRAWRLFAKYSPIMPIGRIVSAGTKRKLTSGEVAAYDAPFPGAAFKAGARKFPALVPTSPQDPAVPANRQAWAALGEWHKPFLTLFGVGDPILGRADKPLHEHVPGATGQPHGRLSGGHFVQEDQGAEIAKRTVAWMQA